MERACVYCGSTLTTHPSRLCEECQAALWHGKFPTGKYAASWFENVKWHQAKEHRYATHGR